MLIEELINQLIEKCDIFDKKGAVDVTKVQSIIKNVKHISEVKETVGFFFPREVTRKYTIDHSKYLVFSDSRISIEYDSSTHSFKYVYSPIKYKGHFLTSYIFLKESYQYLSKKGIFGSFIDRLLADEEEFLVNITNIIDNDIKKELIHLIK